MATERVYLNGKSKFAHLVQPDHMYNKWQILLYPDDASLKKIKELQSEGIKNKLKKDEDGYNMTFSRPTFRDNKKLGTTTPMAPPLILEKDGSPWERTTLVGNGSDVTIGLEVYEHQQPGTAKKAKAARLMSVRVENLVPYDKYIKDEGDPALIKDQPLIVM
jgi:hypothetical protein